jgi:hypothetical protein
LECKVVKRLVRLKLFGKEVGNVGVAWYVLHVYQFGSGSITHGDFVDIDA